MPRLIKYPQEFFTDPKLNPTRLTSEHHTIDLIATLQHLGYRIMPTPSGLLGRMQPGWLEVGLLQLPIITHSITILYRVTKMTRVG